jgi:uncharacterized protein YdhG (YjbR/CyaY superfamily)
MDRYPKNITTVEQYLALYSGDVLKRLKTMRSLIKKLAPKAEEMIRYGMPAYKINNQPVVYFAAMKQHIGFYPTPSAVNAFKAKLKDYECSKGAVQLPLDKPLPLPLITAMVKFKVKEVVGDGRRVI